MEFRLTISDICYHNETPNGVLILPNPDSYYNETPNGVLILPNPDSYYN